MINTRFGRLVIVATAPNSKWRARRYECLCDCGNRKTVGLSELKSGHTKSCGCIANELMSKNMSTHGHSKTPTYRTWIGMKSRCQNTNYGRFNDYGGRGITVCERWQSFELFLADMGERPQGMELDRIDNDGNYTKENCRWVSSKENGRNTRKNVFLTHDGKTCTIAEWAEILGIGSATIHFRHSKGWTAERILTQPLKKRIQK